MLWGIKNIGIVVKWTWVQKILFSIYWNSGKPYNYVFWGKHANAKHPGDYAGSLFFL